MKISSKLLALTTAAALLYGCSTAAPTLKREIPPGSITPNIRPSTPTTPPPQTGSMETVYPPTSQPGPEEALRKQTEIAAATQSQEQQEQTRGTYKNQALGFQLQLTGEWDLPSSTDQDPHLYSTKNCLNSEKISCRAMEVMLLKDKATDADIESSIKNLMEEKLSPIKNISLVKDATVVASKSSPPAEGWSYQYELFFQKAKKHYIMFTNDKTLEETVLPTFHLLD